MRTIPYPALVDHSPSLSLQLCRVQIRERHASPRHPILFGPIDLSGAPVSLVLVRNGHSARGMCIPRWERAGTHWYRLGNTVPQCSRPRWESSSVAYRSRQPRAAHGSASRGTHRVDEPCRSVDIDGVRVVAVPRDVGEQEDEEYGRDEVQRFEKGRPRQEMDPRRVLRVEVEVLVHWRAGGRREARESHGRAERAKAR